MKYDQFLLTKLAEEASEIAQIALKTQQFGFDEKHPDLAFTNKERIKQELNDIMAIIEVMNDKLDFGYVKDTEAIAQKKVKLDKYLRYSIGLGLVQE